MVMPLSICCAAGENLEALNSKLFVVNLNPIIYTVRNAENAYIVIVFNANNKKKYKRNFF